MAQFSYKARTPEGEVREGMVEARTLDAAVAVLQRSNLIVTEVRPVAAAPIFTRRMGFFERVKQRDLVVFSRQFATLFQAKVPVTQSLRTLGAESENPALRVAVTAILDDVSGGSSLSQALARQQRVFSHFYVSMVRAGEESGKLEEVFVYLADYLERSYGLTSKARSALMYPAFVLVTFIGVVIVMLVTVIPRLTSIFAELGQQVPFYTRVVIFISEFLRNWGVLLLVLLAAVAVVGWRFARTDRGGLFFDELKLHIPIVGGLWKKIYLARLADNLSTLIIAGIPIIRALEITSDVVSSRVYERIINDATQAVKGGNTISAAFSRYREIPPLITQMVRVGEESGKLDFILKSAAAFYQRDVDDLLDNFVTLIEPALIIFLGLGIGGLIAAVLVPLYNLSSIM